MNFVSVCRNVIQKNNKNGWVDPDPTIRISTSKTGKAKLRSHSIGIADKEGNIVARLITTKDGKPVLKCGAKVALITEYNVVPIE